MFHALRVFAGTAVLQRAVLLANHVLSSEPSATERLRRHAGRHLRIEFVGWPSLLPVLAFDVTPAGLIEWRGDVDSAVLSDLRVTIDASNPALAIVRGLGGTRPAIDITGDAQFAADVSWLIDNLKWDLEDDLAQLIGQGPAHQAARVGQAAAGAFRAVAARMTALAERAGGSASGTA